LEADDHSWARRHRDPGAHHLEHRVFYIAKFEEAVYVLHAFEKRTRQTPRADIELARKRLADLIRRRAQKPETK
jgi:phage-related protein